MKDFKYNVYEVVFIKHNNEIDRSKIKTRAKQDL